MGSISDNSPSKHHIYAVSTHSFLLVVEFDPQWQIVNHEILKKGYHFGMALIRHADSERYAESNEPLYLAVYHGGTSVKDQDNKQILIYEIGDSYELVDTISLDCEYGDVHQVAYANGGFYIANTACNEIVFRTVLGDRFHKYQFEGVSNDRNHINSIYPCGDQIIAMLHNNSHKESELAILQHNLADGFQLRHTLSLWSRACHNIFLDENQIIYNASRDHQLVMVDLQQDKIVKKINFGGWHSKGLSVIDDCLVVGLSEHSLRDKRATARGKLAILDKNSLSILSIVDLNLPTLHQQVGNINEVRCLTEADLGHARIKRLDINWHDLKLAKKYPLWHRLYRLQTRLLMQLLRLRNLLR